jgi:predicted Ser/Thr protein kinase
MSEVEKVLDVKGDHETFRQGIMTKIGAWSVDHAGEKPDYPAIFPEYFERLSSSYYAQQRQRVVRILRDALNVLAGEEGSLPQDRVRPAQGMLDRLEADSGYCRHCAREAISLLVRKRYSD